MGATTTDLARLTDTARPRRPGVSVRTRITVTVAVLVAIALAGAGLIIYALESARLESAAADQADQEVAEFLQLRENGTDPVTGKPFASTEALLRVFLERNVPSDDELFIGWIGNRARFQSTSKHDVTDDFDLIAEIRDNLAAGRTVRTDSSAGELLVTMQPVEATSATGGQTAGGLVVVTFLDDARGELTSLLRTYAIVSLLSLGAITAVAAWQSGRLLAPLRSLNDTAREITGTDLSRRLPETGNDDITALTRTFNDMLARLEAAFAGQRQFLDDAGHELRTPLTVLAGHLELLDADNPADVAAARAQLADEVDRMSRLVGDLILLAQAGRPGFITRHPVDLDDLTESVLAKARALGDRCWESDGVGVVTLRADQQRLTQAVLQLAENAVKHTGPGDVVAIGSAYDGGVARLWVRDAGPGVAPGDRDVVFERFGRGGAPSGDDGFGLGLTIVREIAEANGGSVGVTDSPGGGARFEITLPADDLPEEEPWHAS
jgi:signal transduction histidine kinase